MASTFKLKRKLFFLDQNGNVVTAEQIMEMKKQQGGTYKNALSAISKNNATQDAINAEVRATTRNLNKQSNAQFKQLGATGDKSGINALKQQNAFKGAAQGGFKAGQNSVGVMQGMKNTWNRMGTMGKAGTVAGAAVVGGLALKGLFGSKKNN